MIKIYKDNAANAIFIEDANGVQFLNSLQAIVDSSLVSILDLARDLEIVSGVAHTEFVDENDDVYTGDANSVCDELNAIFTGSGSTGEVPNITSSSTANLVEGESLNYELTADYGVGYEWTSLPLGVATVDGNPRRIIGGSSLTAGTYVITAKAINYFGEDTLALTLTVSSPPFANTKSVEFQNNDYCGANAALLDSTLGRVGNGSGSGDAWSIAFWFKAGTSNNQNQTIFYFGSSDVANGNHIVITYNGDNSARRRINFRYGSDNNNLLLQTPVGSVSSSDGWQHVMITYDGGTTGASSGDINNYYSRFDVFIDGVSQTLTGSNSNFGNTTALSGQNLRIGRYSSGAYMRNSCKVDELAIFSADESNNIGDIYNSGAPHDLSALSNPPEHWWRMGDGDTFSSLQDSGDTGGCVFVMSNMTAASIVSDVP